MRVFGGWTFEEIAETLGAGLSTAKRDWKTALIWLRRELSPK
jgi:DNA-directed RNA polymerase specialized sigma24 family protein